MQQINERVLALRPTALPVKRRAATAGQQRKPAFLVHRLQHAQDLDEAGQTARATRVREQVRIFVHDQHDPVAWPLLRPAGVVVAQRSPIRGRTDRLRAGRSLTPGNLSSTRR